MCTKKLCGSYIHLAAFLAGIVLTVVSLSIYPAHTALGNTCHFYDNTSASVTGFGLPYNPRTTDLILTATCDSSDVTVQIDPGANQYTYQYGYYFHNGSWERYTYQGGVKDGEWLIGPASYQIPPQVAVPGEVLYFVGYTCMFESGRWYCGCDDASCTESYWQLQRIDVPQVSTEVSILCRDVLPQDTDSAIDTALEPHYVCVPENQTDRSGSLWVFFHGTGATPKEYTLLAQEAAEAGLHSIHLRYSDSESINIRTCPRDPDPDCHEKVRNEIHYGVDTSAHVDVNYTNSIDNRLASLLAYLNDEYPSEDWDQYLSGNNAINWDKTRLGGHSQGGGHATFRSKREEVERVVIFTWVDIKNGELAPWILAGGETPSDRYYIFWHVNDTLIASHIPALRTALGINAYGPEVNVDTSVSPYNNTHTLSTAAPEPVGMGSRPTRSLPHNMIVLDESTQLTNDDEPIWKPVWRYLLTGEVLN